MAAGLHQILDLNRKIGPRNTLAKARSHLEPCAPVLCGVDVAGLLASVGQWQEWLESDGDRPEVPRIGILDTREVI